MASPFAVPLQSGKEAGARASSIPYVLPFVIFLILLALAQHLPISQTVEYALRVGIMGLVLLFVSRRVIDFRVRRAAGTIALGAAVFAVWVAPDALWPHYREQWLLQNPITGTLQTSLRPGMSENWLVLGLRFLRATLIVPIVEELFWRAWLMRWLIRPRFDLVPLGAYSAGSFWATAVLFASEHGPFWDVGLLAGVAYNLWMIRTKSLGDCILAHAVTNACLSTYVLLTKSWQYWL